MNQYQQHIERRVREIIEQTIDDLKDLGMADDQALSVMLIQSVVRMEDVASVRRALGPVLNE